MYVTCVGPRRKSEAQAQANDVMTRYPVVIGKSRWLETHWQVGRVCVQYQIFRVSLGV